MGRLAARKNVSVRENPASLNATLKVGDPARGAGSPRLGGDKRRVEWLHTSPNTAKPYS